MTELFQLEEVEIVRRSQLERWANCPAQAMLSENNNSSVGMAALIGTETHEAVSATISHYLEKWGCDSEIVEAGELADVYRANAGEARADVIPFTQDVAKYSSWALAKLLEKIHPDDILAYDGGEGAKSGQFALDMDGVRLTCEVDLLVQGAAPSVVKIIDWKSGWKEWSASDVKESFQFRFYAWMVARNLSDVEEVHVQVFNHKARTLTPAIVWRIDGWDVIEQQIAAALRTMKEQRAKDQPEYWPELYRCSICDHAASCPAAGKEAADLVRDPAEYVDEMVALDAKLGQMKKLATKYADEHGTITGRHSGAKFGRDKPSSRKASAQLY